MDLIIENIENNPFKPAPTQDLDIFITITNLGTIDSGAFYLDWYANRATPPSPGDVGRLYIRINTLAAGDSNTIPLVYSGYDTVGTYQMWAQIDTNEEVIESNETNNIFGPQAINVNTCRADINEDNEVNFEDFARLAAAWLSSSGEGNWDQEADLLDPVDGNIDLDDLQVLADNWLCSE